jgi:magnesium transporter
MPELHQPWGYPAALAAMLASALGCFLVFKWKKWL